MTHITAVTELADFVPESPPPLRQFALPEIWSENNRKISIMKEICITINFAHPEKFLEESQVSKSKKVGALCHM